MSSPMTGKLGIEGCDDTINFAAGCRAAGCELGEHCWALVMANRLAHNPKTPRYRGLVERGPDGKLHWTGKTFCDLDILRTAVKRRKPTVFAVNLMGDVFHAVPEDQQGEAFVIMARAERHRFVILTKQPGKALVMLAGIVEDPPPWLSQEHIHSLCCAVNRGRIWLGTSVTDQLTADQRIPQLCTWPGKRFVSVEPMLGPVMLRPEWYGSVHWIALGCESGPGARPTKLVWVRALIEQCTQAGIPVMVKQLKSKYHQRDLCTDEAWHSLNRTGSTPPFLNAVISEDGLGKLIHMPMVDGRVWDERPPELQREEKSK